MKHLMMCKVYTDVGGTQKLYHVCPPVRKIIHSLEDYFHVQVDNPWYNYYIALLIFQQMNIFHDLLKQYNLTLVTSAVVTDKTDLSVVIARFLVSLFKIYSFTIPDNCDNFASCFNFTFARLRRRC